MKHHIYIGMFLLVLFAAVAWAQSPSPPRDLEGSFDSGRVTLRWEAPEDSPAPSFYRIYRGSGMHDHGLIGSSLETHYTDTTVSPNLLYIYAVTAVYHDTVESPPSNLAFVGTGNGGGHDSSSGIIKFTSTPPTTARLGQPFVYDPVVTTTPPGLRVCFHLDDSPDGMSINDSTGTVTWTPSEAGNEEIRIIASVCSLWNARTVQEFTVMVVTGAPGSLSGTVRNTTGQGIGNVKIKLFDVGSEDFLYKTLTDSNGHYSFNAVNPSTYYVRAKPENDNYRPQWYNGAAHLSDATPVTIPESTAVIADFVLQHKDTAVGPYTVRGTVLDDSSHPVKGALVSAFRFDHDTSSDNWFDDHHDGEYGDGNHGGQGDNHGDESDGIRTDDSGHYTLTLRGGTWIIGVRAWGFLPQFWNHRSSALTADQLVLTQDTTGINFDLVRRHQGTGSITGYIRAAADSSGLRSHVIGFLKDSTGHFSEPVSSTESDSAGLYTLEHLDNGNYIVLAFAGHDYFPTFYTPAGGSVYLDSAVAVPVTGGNVGGITMYLAQDSVDGLNSINGDVDSDSHGPEMRAGRAPSSISPLGGVIVTIANTARIPVGFAITTNDGSYHAAGIAPGTYTVTFQTPEIGSTTTTISLSYSNNAPVSAVVNASLSSTGNSGQFTTFSLNRFWNLVSLPVSVPDARAVAVFPGASSKAYQFLGSYQSQDVLTQGRGYWIKYPSGTSMSLGGSAVTSTSVTVTPGWNLIGSISTPVPVTSVMSIPSGMTTSAFFGYNGRYSVASVISPGQGYWVKVNQAGSLILTSPGTVLPKAAAGLITIVPTGETPPAPPSESSIAPRPTHYALGQNYPNPFNPTTTISYQLPVDSKVSLTIFNLLGQVVATPVSDGTIQQAGDKSVEWNAAGLASGIYFYRLNAASVEHPEISFSSLKKLVLIK